MACQLVRRYARGRTHRGRPFAAAVAVVAYAVALGRHTPLFRLLYRAGLNSIRYPEKWLMPAAFILIVFAAIVVERFLDDAAVRRSTQIAATAFVVVNAIAGDATRGVATSIALALILFLRGRLLLALLVLFVLVDLGAHVPEIAPRIDERFYTEPPAIARGIPPRARLYNDADWQLARMPNPPPLPSGARWERVHNAMFPELQALWDFDSVLENDITLTNLRPSLELLTLFQNARFGARRDLIPMLLGFAGTTHVVTLRDPASPSDPVRVVPLPANQRLYFASELAATSRIGEPHPWPRGIAFVERPFAPSPARVVGVREQPSAIDVDVDAAGRALLVIAVTPHKYWRATIDDAPAPLVRANLGFQAIEVGAGRHHVAMRYRNPLVIVFGFLSLAGTLALAVIAATDAALRSRAPRPRPPRSATPRAPPSES